METVIAPVPPAFVTFSVPEPEKVNVFKPPSRSVPSAAWRALPDARPSLR